MLLLVPVTIDSQIFTKTGQWVTVHTKAYDALGRKLNETNAKGTITTYTCDDSNNLLAVGVKKNADTSEQTMKKYTYDLDGR